MRERERVCERERERERERECVREREREQEGGREGGICQILTIWLTLVPVGPFDQLL